MVADETFLMNLRHARENGYEMVCAECGYGVLEDVDDDPVMHDSGCSHYSREAFEAEARAMRERAEGGT